MSHDIESYCKTCSICVTSKDANSKPTSLLHSLPIVSILKSLLDAQSPMLELLSLRWTLASTYVLHPSQMSMSLISKLEDSHQRFSVFGGLEGWRVGGLEGWKRKGEN